jgi:hypothetical protein
MTKKEVYEWFKNEYCFQMVFKKRDRVALEEMWAEFTDRLCKEGLITQNQFSRWQSPFQGKYR